MAITIFKESSTCEAKNVPIYSLLFLVQGWGRNLCFCNSWSSMSIQDYSQVMFQDFNELVARIRKEYLATGIRVWIQDFSSGLGICSDNSRGWDTRQCGTTLWASFLGCFLVHGVMTHSESNHWPALEWGKVWQESHLLQWNIGHLSE